MAFFSFDPLAWAVFGTGGVVLGSMGLLLARLKGGARLLWLAAAAVLLLLTVVAVSYAQPGWLWEPLLALAAVEGCLGLLRVRRLVVALGERRSVRAHFVRPRLDGRQLARLGLPVDAEPRHVHR